MKGEYNQECNITSCQKPNSAVWFNHSTRKYYCKSCAMGLNNDVFNAQDAQKMFGHTLCTLEENVDEPTKNKPYDGSLDGLLKSKIETFKIEPLALLPEIISLEYKSGRENRRERRKQQRKNK